MSLISQKFGLLGKMLRKSPKTPIFWQFFLNLPLLPLPGDGYLVAKVVPSTSSGDSLGSISSPYNEALYLLLVLLLALGHLLSDLGQNSAQKHRSSMALLIGFICTPKGVPI